MEQEEKERLEELLSTFSSSGWGYIEEDLKEKVTLLSNGLTNPDITDTQFRLVQGRIDSLKYVLSLKELFNKVAEEAKDEQALSV